MNALAPKPRGGPPHSLFQKGNPGRKPGSRNVLSESFLSALYKDFEQHGEAAIEGARAESPLGYCKMIASLLPAKVEVARNDTAVSDDDLMAIIRGAIAHEAKESGTWLDANVATSGTA